MRSFKSRDPKTMLTLWKALIVPIIDYCSVLTSPYKQGDIEKLESLQRAFTNKIELDNNKDFIYIYNKTGKLPINALYRMVLAGNLFGLFFFLPARFITRPR